MMTRIHGKIQFECDDCADVLDTETKDFQEAKAAFRAAGWRSTPTKGVWRDLCHECGSTP